MSTAKTATKEKKAISPIGKKIMKALKDKGLRPSDLWKAKVVSNPAFYNILNGKHQPQEKTKDAIWKFLGINEDGDGPTGHTLVDAKDKQIQEYIGKLPKAKKENQVVIGGSQFVKHTCPMCKGDGTLWVPIGQ